MPIQRPRGRPPAARLTWVKTLRQGRRYLRATMNTPPSLAPSGAPPRHRLHEDLQGLVTGCLFAALGVFLFQQAGLLPGGTVGLALLIHYSLGLDLGLALVLANLPFYGLAWLRMGPAFTLKTVAAVSLLALASWWLPQGLGVQQVSGLLAALLGGLLCGAGILILFRHRASLGGFNVLALYLQEKAGLRAGKVQMLLDGAVVLGGGLLVGDWRTIALSVLAAVAVNFALAVNHRPGRYTPN